MESLRKNAPWWSALTHDCAYRDPCATMGATGNFFVCTVVSTHIDFRWVMVRRWHQTTHGTSKKACSQRNG
jgi:hypothetical protein